MTVPPVVVSWLSMDSYDILEDSKENSDSYFFEEDGPDEKISS